jgi:hypothetical protein
MVKLSELSLLPNTTLYCKVTGMDTNWAEENLQTIRILMERSAIYRRALAPIMLFVGIVGVTAAAIGLLLPVGTLYGFLILWISAAVLALAGAFRIARRQALKDKEPFWSPPTRRVTQALVPPLAAGLCLGVLPAFFGPSEIAVAVALVWILFYGFALHAAGFFMRRGIKVFGWLFIASVCLLIYGAAAGWIDLENKAHWLMGLFFGVLHLAYGAYLYLTEKRKNAA